VGSASATAQGTLPVVASWAGSSTMADLKVCQSKITALLRLGPGLAFPALAQDDKTKNHAFCRAEALLHPKPQNLQSVGQAIGFFQILRRDDLADA